MKIFVDNDLNTYNFSKLKNENKKAQIVSSFDLKRISKLNVGEKFYIGCGENIERIK